jgi:hypothetical protein
MKKLLLLIFISVSFRLSAQTNVYHPFPEDTALWIVSWTQQNNNPIQRDLYIMNGDTLINGMSYNKIYIAHGVYNGPFSTPHSSSLYLGAMRQDKANKKVYYKNANMKSDTLLYDFNLKVGDVLPATYLTVGGSMNNPKPIVTSIKDTLINGLHYNRFTFNSSSIYGHLIDGIGSDCGLFQMTAHWEGGPTLSCFKTHNISAADSPPGLYSACGFYYFPTGIYNEQGNNFPIKLSPNPSTGIFNINSPEKLQYSVHDVLGREIFQTVTPPVQSTTLDLSIYPKGIYFVVGKFEEKIFSRKIILQ